MMDDIWADRYWAHEVTNDPMEAGPILGTASSIEELHERFGHYIEVWDAKEQDWV